MNQKIVEEQVKIKGGDTEEDDLSGPRSEWKAEREESKYEVSEENIM